MATRNLKSKLPLSPGSPKLSVNYFSLLVMVDFAVVAVVAVVVPAVLSSMSKVCFVISGCDMC